MAGKRRWHLLDFTLYGLPELGHFESDEKRQEALEQIGREAANPASAWFWGAILLLAGSVLAAIRAVRLVLSRWSWPPLVVELTVVAAAVAVFALVVRWLHRMGASRVLRLILVEQGVPVCFGCGYLLRGLPPASARCPECGRSFDASVIRLLGGKAVDFDE